MVGHKRIRVNGKPGDVVFPPDPWHYYIGMIISVERDSVGFVLWLNTFDKSMLLRSYDGAFSQCKLID